MCVTIRAERQSLVVRDCTRCRRCLVARNRATSVVMYRFGYLSTKLKPAASLILVHCMRRAFVCALASRRRMQRVINLTQTGTNESVKSVRAERQRRTQREAAVVGSVVGLERTTGRRTCMKKIAFREKQSGCGSLLALPKSLPNTLRTRYSLFSTLTPKRSGRSQVATGSQRASRTRSRRRRKRRKKRK